MTQELRRLIDVVQREAVNDGYKDRPESDSTFEAKAMLMDAILELLDRVEKAERLFFELREAAAAVVSNEEHAFSGGMRKYAEGSQTWQVYEDLRIAMEASK